MVRDARPGGRAEGARPGRRARDDARPAAVPVRALLRRGVGPPWPRARHAQHHHHLGADRARPHRGAEVAHPHGAEQRPDARAAQGAVPPRRRLCRSALGRLRRARGDGGVRGAGQGEEGLTGRMINPTTDRVLITGAAGAIGSALRTGLHDRWRKLRLTDVRPVTNLSGNEEFVAADITDRAALEAMMRDVQAVVHLAGVVGTYTLE